MLCMLHLDLFSGIGGFSLAVDTVWHEQKNEHIFVEWEAFPQAVLRKHWPDAKIHGDIRKFVTDAAQQRREGECLSVQQRGSQQACVDIDRPYLITGGFPCQPFSHAGRRKGTDDDRYLWPPMLDAIALFRPRWVIAENVAGLATWNDGLVLETVCSDLEKEGYEVQPFIIPACAVGAPHRRDRIWIVAFNAEHDGCDGSENGKGGTTRSDRHATGSHQVQQPSGSTVSRTDAANAGRMGRPARRTEAIQSARKESERTDIIRSSQWNENWIEAAARLCAVDDGLSGGLVRPRGWRNAALKAAGNAIVPQVVIEIMRAIKEADVHNSLAREG